MSLAFWRVLISVRLTITLLVLILSGCIAGSFIAQKGMTQKPLEQLYTAATLKWMTTFGLIDIFHSPLFVFILLMLALNLIACSIERLPRIWKTTFHVPAPPVSDPLLEDWDPKQARKGKYLLHRLGQGKAKTFEEARLALLLFFERNAKRHAVLKDDGKVFQIMLEKGKYSRLGVYITHLSLLMIMFGGVIGAIGGFEGGVNVEEGTRASWIQHNRGSLGGLRPLRENGAPVHGYLGLPFEVECQKFQLTTYDGTRPKDFRSWLNFYENDVKTASVEIAVNHPFTYKGITFYQASYAEVGQGGANVTVIRGGKDSKDMEPVEGVSLNNLYRIDGNAAFRLVSVENNLMNLGPAVRVEYFENKTTKTPALFWIFKNLPGFDFAHRAKSLHHFVLKDLQPKYATGLSVAKDPGVEVVWGGAGLLIFALFLALYTFHSRVWVAWTPGKGFTVVGWSNKLFLFEPRFEKLLDNFKKELLA